jgi:putative nucleotidyltransferase with HDIG domain
VFLPAARALAERLLAAAMPDRWRHVGAVAEAAESTGSALSLDTDVLVAAAWLHDIGYSPALSDTGFHPLDGARYLRDLAWDPDVVQLVAHHSGAVIEAEERGLRSELLAEFPFEQSASMDALWYCDMTTGPDGQAVSVEERLAEIRARYGPGDVVTRFVERAEPELVAAVRRVEERLAAAQSR